MKRILWAALAVAAVTLGCAQAGDNRTPGASLTGPSTLAQTPDSNPPTDPCAELGGDTDGDSVCDKNDNCPLVANSAQIDSDKDGTGGACEPPTGNEGCTPGDWKTHLSAWNATPFSPSYTLESVFNIPDSLGIDNMTLLQAASAGGGGVTALLRHAVAALLGAAHPSVDYPITVAQVVGDVNSALASGSAATIENLKNQLDTWNNLHAPGFCD